MTAHLLRFRHDGMIRLQSAIMFSVLVHALILTILFFSPAFPSRTFTFGPAYSVDLVSAP